MERMWADLRYALRSLATSPQFTVTAIVGLSVGLSIASLMFSVVNAFLFRPLPVRNGGDLVALSAQKPTASAVRNLSYPNLVDIRDQLQSFDGVIAYSLINPSVRESGFSERVYGQVVTGNYFEFLGLSAASGRMLLPRDDTPAAAAAVVISHAFWKNRLRSDASIVGGVLYLNGSPFEVVGIAAEQFHGIDSLLRSDLWITTAHAEKGGGGTRDRDGNTFRIRGHLRAGVTFDQAQSELDVLSERLRERYPADNAGLRMSLVPEARTRPLMDMRDFMPVVGAMLMGLALIVLMNTCANVVGLMLARSVARQKEVSLRLALGAGARRVVGNLVLEGALVSLAAGVVGFLVMRWGAISLAAAVPLDSPYRFDIQPNLTVFVFTVLLAAGAGVGVALVPALSAVRTDVHAALQYAHGATMDRRRTRGRARVVMTQFALVTVLLTTAGLFMRSMQNATQADLGFQTDNRILFSVSPGGHGYDAARGSRLVDDLLTAAREIPGVRAASIVHDVPLGPSSSSVEVRPADDAGAEPARISYTVIGGGYFEATQMPLVRGRSFDRRDTAAGRPVAIVNEALANRFWPNQDAVGRQLMLPRENGRDRVYDVVGVSKNATYNSLFETPRGYIYFPYEQNYRPEMTFVLHTETNAPSVIAAARERLREIDGAMALYDASTFDAMIDANALGTTRVGAGLLVIFGGLGTLMAVLGMYGFLIYMTQLQRREIGIRMAVGATAAAVTAFLVKRGMWLAVRGIAAGLVLAVAFAALIQGFMFGVGAIEPAIIGTVFALLGGIALVAAYLPARRILAGNPIGALGRE